MDNKKDEKMLALVAIKNFYQITKHELNIVQCLKVIKKAHTDVLLRFFAYAID